MVVSPLIARQMQWSDGADYLAASDPDQMAEYCIRLYGNQQLWESFRANGLARIEADLNPGIFGDSLRRILGETAPHSRRLASG